MIKTLKRVMSYTKPLSDILCIPVILRARSVVALSLSSADFIGKSCYFAVMDSVNFKGTYENYSNSYCYLVMLNYRFPVAYEPVYE